ncbi:hypothetical protein PR202_ga12334 [Eleusine coracana subsp. coracana]|uniref:Uncharacterized protein n=1 Tax=Eleusine coracana subsp. coracana TaxID=191504 RepID=A0AAV5CB82_ELECO|nr:hypothetical protein PR202_ga12334 [Eleusine coracana subsp. coracana]
MKRRRLVKRWIAEGYVRRTRGSEPEEVGERIFNEFLNMAIIQPIKFAAITSGRVISCNVNPLMLELSISKAIEEKLVCMLDNHSNATAMTDTIRHIVVRSGWQRDQEAEYESMNFSRVRSLTVFGEWRPFLLSRKMRMLRVLDLEGVEGLTGHDLKHIGKFRHLKYLGLRSTNIEHLPKSVGNLQGLETLDIKCTKSGSRSLQFNDLEMDQKTGGAPLGIDVPRDIGDLRALNTLEDFFHTLGHLKSLQYLNVRSELEDSDGLSRSSRGLFFLKSALERLEVLKLYGYLPILPVWISNSRNLFKLHLCRTKLRTNGSTYRMNDLACLPYLTSLLLLSDSITAAGLIFPADGFQEVEARAMPNLRMLQVWGCNNLQQLQFRVGGMPNLETLLIRSSMNLLIGFEAGTMPKLKVLQIHESKKLQWFPLRDSTDTDPMMQCLSINEGVMPNLEILKISSCHELPNLTFGCGALPKLETLEIICCDNLEELSFRSGAVPKLESLIVVRCDNLKLLSGYDGRLSMGTLTNFHVEACPSLRLLQFRRQEMPNLEKLELLYSVSLSVVLEAGAVPKLKMLHIDECERLQCFPLGALSRSSSDEEGELHLEDEVMSGLPDFDTNQAEGCHDQIRSSPSGETEMMLDPETNQTEDLDDHVHSSSSSEREPVDQQSESEDGDEQVKLEEDMMLSLQTLKIGSCNGLYGLSFQCGAMPMLESLQIRDCDNLKSGGSDQKVESRTNGDAEKTEDAAVMSPSAAPSRPSAPCAASGREQRRDASAAQPPWVAARRTRRSTLVRCAHSASCAASACEQRLLPSRRARGHHHGRLHTNCIPFFLVMELLLRRRARPSSFPPSHTEIPVHLLDF